MKRSISEVLHCAGQRIASGQEKFSCLAVREGVRNGRHLSWGRDQRNDMEDWYSLSTNLSRVESSDEWPTTHLKTAEFDAADDEVSRQYRLMWLAWLATTVGDPDMPSIPLPEGFTL